MASNTNVGLGIGLQAKLTAPSRIFAADQAEKQQQRKLNAAAQKEKDDELEAIKKKILLDKPKIHRLLAQDVSTSTASALREMTLAKQNNPNDYLTKVYDIWGGLQTNLNEATTRSTVLNQFEKDMTSTTGKEYVSRDVKSAYDLMSKSKNLNAWYQNMQTAGVKNSQFFSYSPEVGAFNYAVVPKVDPDQYAKVKNEEAFKNLYKLEDKKSIVAGKEVRDAYQYYGTVDTEDEATQIFQDNLNAAGGDITRAIPKPTSGQSIANSYFNIPGAREQYLDLNPDVTSENMVEHFMNNYYKPNKKSTVARSTRGGGMTFVSNVSVGGGDDKVTYFKFEKSPKTISWLGSKAVESAGQMSLSENKIPFQGAASQEFIDFKTGKRVKGDAITSQMVINEILPMAVEIDTEGSNKGKYKLIDGKINLLNIAELKAIKEGTSPNKKAAFDIIPFVAVSKKNELGMNMEMMDQPLIVELKKVEGQIMQNIPSTGKNPARGEFEKQIAEMRKYIQELKTEYTPTK
jgi:hypothetical protein